jgi:hypothetical protein
MQKEARALMPSPLFETLPQQRSAVWMLPRVAVASAAVESFHSLGLLTCLAKGFVDDGLESLDQLGGRRFIVVQFWSVFLAQPI